MQAIEKIEKAEKAKRFRVFGSPLAIAGIILLVLALLLGGLIFVLGAEPNHGFYTLLCTALGFLAINPLVIRMRNSHLLQGILIGAAAASIVWLFI